ncbi:hypothetical protein NM208_g14630 [Fusarium decemcellulare]|uniref:Uncharacterized protein n=1 Tax=Fusarium decemcellulare TaxID=57161 RepID=A0ACC1RI06_9HYPO|nr:hypothetical protein NM208_g14630 [Fusarium decemcellulare]
MVRRQRFSKEHPRTQSTRPGSLCNTRNHAASHIATSKKTYDAGTTEEDNARERKQQKKARDPAIAAIATHLTEMDKKFDAKFDEHGKKLDDAYTKPGESTQNQLNMIHRAMEVVLILENGSESLKNMAKGTGVWKFGSSTGPTYGTVDDIRTKMHMKDDEYLDDKKSRYSTEYTVIGRSSGVGGKFSGFGDSGSVVFNSLGEAVGLLFSGQKPDAAKNGYSLVTPIEDVLEDIKASSGGVIEDIPISTRGVLLVPYEAHHVRQYHAWMQDPHIQEATASEPMALEEEYENQQSWRTSSDKLTFIVCAPLQQQQQVSIVKAGTADSDPLMRGDINFFLYPYEGDDDEADKGWLTGEVDVMIASPSQRGQGLGRAAVCALLVYLRKHVDGVVGEYGDGELKGLMVKIKEGNKGSRALFEKLGFVQKGEVNYFGEVVMTMQWEDVVKRDWWEGAEGDYEEVSQSRMYSKALSSIPLGLLFSTAAAETIHGVVVFSRHGDRSTKWYGAQSLTSLGAEQNFQVGSDYRSRYLSSDSDHQILGISEDEYKPSQIFASAPDQGILMNTATAFLQGLYPPLADLDPEIASQTLNNGSQSQAPLDGYQYVRLHTINDNSPDTIWIKGDDACPKGNHGLLRWLL